MTAIVALTGGYLFQLIDMPVPWLLGSLSAVLLYNQGLKKPTYWPFKLREIAQIILGYVMGCSFTPEAGLGIVKSLPAMFFSNIMMAGFTILSGYYVSRLAGIPSPSCILGSIPGGITQMILLCDDIEDSDVTIVAFMQTVRIITVVFAVPFLVLHSVSPEVVAITARNLPGSDSSSMPFWFLAFFIPLAALGGMLGKKLRFPTPYLLGSLLTIAVLSLFGVAVPQMPSWLVVASQVSFGAYFGNSMKMESLQNWKRMLSLSLLSSGALIAVTFLMGYLLTRMYPVDLLSIFLALAPGGMTEMAITAITVNAVLTTVTSYQLFRILFINLIIPPFLKRILVNKKECLERT